ncbi:MAG: methyltransferase [Rhodobacteraceae bacterium]|nr:methyltransferase [Paracoccaceae bacterium]
MPATIDPTAKTYDAFLGGAVYVHQPERGRHRAGLDAVFLAAALPDGVSGDVMDLGSGVGTAGLCAAARLSEISVTLVDIDQLILDLARDNLKDPGNATFAGRVRILDADITAKGDVRHAAGLLPDMTDHVIMNPPYYGADKFRASPDAARAEAHMLDERGLDPWIRTASDVLKPGGTLTIVFRADGLPEILETLKGRFGAIQVLPLFPHPGAAATRILVRAVRGSKAPMQLLPGVTLHASAGGTYTDLAESVLRHGKGLNLFKNG